ncbi:MAG TPA: HAMP domain-containing sensor histidine kinase [Kofleriaceae bacterium]|nr:HAMP domain-containing sensor histidine kinase [Kofleriaceae bacterium]
MVADSDEQDQELRRLRELLQFRESFLAVIAHELRNPLGPILLSVEALLDELMSEPLEKASLVTRVTGLRGYVERLRRDLDRLLDFSRLRAGMMDLRPELADLSLLVRQTLAEMRPLIEHSRCEVRLEPLQPQPQTGFWDRMRLEQVIWNLVSNALKYGAGAPVDVRISGDEDTATFSVADHGIGIAPEEQDAVFRKFERLSAHTKHTGFGIGLWLVKRNIDAMGGHIALASQVGAGTTIAVTIPRSR